MILRVNTILLLLVIFVLQINVTTGRSQTLTLSVKAALPAILNESSGIEVVNRNTIWSHNDSGGNPELYNIDSAGTLLRTLHILNAANVDWEDLAQDTTGNFYIGDFGNNSNDRQDLKIYKIPNPSTITVDSIIPEVINFSYPNQFAFPPANALKNFDMEAMVAYHDSLYLFSKDRSDPYSGYTRLYKLPSVAGTYIATLVDSFYTGPGPVIQYSVTGADISPDKSKLILLGYNKCWLFTNFTGDHFFSGTSQVFSFSFLSQKEGVCFISNDELYITDENGSGTGQKLYYANLQQILTSAEKSTGEKNIELTIFPNPFSENASILIRAKEEDFYTLVVYNGLGQNIFEKSFYITSKTPQNIAIDEAVLKNVPGFFIAEVSRKNKPVFSKRFVKLR